MQGFKALKVEKMQFIDRIKTFMEYPLIQILPFHNIFGPSDNNKFTTEPPRPIFVTKCKVGGSGSG